MRRPTMPTVRLISGETVTVVRPPSGRDELGEPAGGEPTREDVEDVVVAPGATSDLEASRPAGVSVALTLCFPKTYNPPLRGCDVEVGGTVYRVVGDPRPYAAENVPGPYNYTVEVTRTNC